MEMASVLSAASWYDYTIHNIFNVANFIEYESYPKRRKLDNSNRYHSATENLTAPEYELDSQSRVRSHQVIYRPYSDIQQQHDSVKHKLAKKAYKRQREHDVGLETQTEEENGQQGTSIDKLYPELLCLIFEKLDYQSKGRVAQVCSRWRDVAYLKSVWKGCIASLHLRRPNPTLFPSLVRRGIKKVQVLSLRKSLRELVNGIPNLESLDLSGCYNLSDSALDTAFNRDIPSLKTLNLSLCKEVTDSSLGRIAQYCKNLEELQLGGCTKITNTGLLLISWGLKNIRSLNLRSCWQISDHGIGHLTGTKGQPSTGAKTLETISLQDCQKLTDESLRYISEGLPTIRELNLSFCVSVTDTGLKSLSQSGSLADLRLRSCDNISDIGIGFLADGCSGLSRLDVSFCDRVSDSSMAHIATGLSQLKSLSLSSCQISDAGIVRIQDMKLETLNIGQCSNLTDSTVQTISTKIKSLRSLDLYGCNAISTQALEMLDKCENLKVVNLGLWHPF